MSSLFMRRRRVQRRSHSPAKPAILAADRDLALDVAALELAKLSAIMQMPVERLSYRGAVAEGARIRRDRSFA